MRILFGPEHDALHVDPATPGVYEWWYFDALSDDGRYALVVIFFLGSPMSPYYRAVVDNKRPDARDWCGVFVSLQEKVTVAGGGERWRERTYAYNLYRGGAFSTGHPDVAIGGSRMQGTESPEGGFCWKLTLNEPGLWGGAARAELSFTVIPLPLPTALSGAPPTTARHTWVCAAPLCQVKGTITGRGGQAVSFRGTGYHDHNAGTLPWNEIAVWYWGRAHLRDNAGKISTAILYDLEHTDSQRQVVALLWQEDRLAVASAAHGFRTLSETVGNAYGLEHASRIHIGVRGQAEFADGFYQFEADLQTERGLLAEGPFYRRLPLHLRVRDARAEPLRARLEEHEHPLIGVIPAHTGAARERALHLTEWEATGQGIGEVFRPSRLCGPIASRAIWTRMRRRG